MNKMPDRIWATPFDSDMDGGTYCDAAERPTSPNHDAWCYVRADTVQALTAERDALEKLAETRLDLARAEGVWRVDSFARAEAAEAERDRLREALADALDAWDTHNKHGDPMQGWWVHDAYAALKGEPLD